MPPIEKRNTEHKQTCKTKMASVHVKKHLLALENF